MPGKTHRVRVRLPGYKPSAPVQPPPECEVKTLGVAFFDLSRMAEWASSDQDAWIATFLKEFYAMAARHIEGAGGRIVKFMGDAGLAVFEPEVAEEVILALGKFAGEARGKAFERGLVVYLNVNVHIGPVVAGPFGAPGAEQFDVIGKTVNIAARLGRRGVTLSPQAFRCLSPQARKQCSKITPPTTYRFLS